MFVLRFAKIDVCENPTTCSSILFREDQPRLSPGQWAFGIFPAGSSAPHILPPPERVHPEGKASDFVRLLLPMELRSRLPEGSPVRYQGFYRFQDPPNRLEINELQDIDGPYSDLD